MNDLTWQAGLILVVIAACVLPLLFAWIAEAMSEDRWDDVAERKRRTERRAKQISREYQA